MRQQQGTSEHIELEALWEGVVGLIDSAAAIVAGGDEILAANLLWEQVTRFHADSLQRPGLEACLRLVSPTRSLIASLRDEGRSSGVISVSVETDGPGSQACRRDYALRWRHFGHHSDGRSLAIIVLEELVAPARYGSVHSMQQARINHLLIRQTLIEENERRRLGVALHDVVIQDLVQVRAAAAKSDASVRGPRRLVGMIDGIIDEIRTLMFELSPPVLEDLGLRPALQWLTDHLNARHGVRVTLIDDGLEPPLSSDARTVIFRAVRELSLNAVKHAPGTEILLTCVSNERTLRIIVRDSGPGFAQSDPPGATGRLGFGLLSVEQQIRGIGGSFDLVSSVCDGTRATIMVPIENQKGTSTVP